VKSVCTVIIVSYVLSIGVRTAGCAGRRLLWDQQRGLHLERLPVFSVTREDVLNVGNRCWSFTAAAWCSSTREAQFSADNHNELFTIAVSDPPDPQYYSHLHHHHHHHHHQQQQQQQQQLWAHSKTHLPPARPRGGLAPVKHPHASLAHLWAGSLSPAKKNAFWLVCSNRRSQHFGPR